MILACLLKSWALSHIGCLVSSTLSHITEGQDGLSRIAALLHVFSGLHLRVVAVKFRMWSYHSLTIGSLSRGRICLSTEVIKDQSNDGQIVSNF